MDSGTSFASLVQKFIGHTEIHIPLHAVATRLEFNSVKVFLPAQENLKVSAALEVPL